MAGALLRGAHDLPISEEEKATVTKIEASYLADAQASMPAAVGAYLTDLAAGIRAGKLEQAKLSADFGAIDKAAALQQGKEAEAISALHDALATQERQSIASTVRSRRAMREKLQPPLLSDAGGTDWTKFRVEHLVHELGLDVDAGQDKRITSMVLADQKREPQSNPDELREIYKRHTEAILAAFEGDAFDAAVLAPPTPRSPHEGAERTATFDASLLPLLAPDQRERLATRVQRFGMRPARFPEDGPMHGGFEGTLEDLGPMLPFGMPPMSPVPPVGPAPH
jgi:hypothetical protein